MQRTEVVSFGAGIETEKRDREDECFRGTDLGLEPRADLQTEIFVESFISRTSQSVGQNAVLLSDEDTLCRCGAMPFARFAGGRDKKLNQAKNGTGHGNGKETTLLIHVDLLGIRSEWATRRQGRSV